jgi:hypothetical protein
MFKDLHSAPSEVQFIVSANTSGGVMEEARNVLQQNATPEHRSPSLVKLTHCSQIIQKRQRKP